ncbi:MAG TPA: hypothetical protein VJ110_02790, partial [Candidatus Nanoarchaeia archaeon]|nr:hypothetical protein [Candidatus Nanoarchaeia archaeon]
MARKQHLPIRLRELITLHEALWLALGLVFGILAARGAPLFIVAIPIAFFIIWAFDFILGCA